MTRQLYGILAIIILALIIVTFGPAACQKIRSQAAQAKVDQGQAGAATDSGAEAVNTVGNVMQSAAETDKTVKEGIDDVRSAPEAERGARTVDAACRLRAYINTDRCARLREAHSGQPAQAR